VQEATQRPNHAPAPVESEKPATEAADVGIQIPRSSRIAWVHNNPGNLMFAGQDGAEKGEPKEGGGYWAHFETPEDGYAALKRQIALDAGRGKTLGQFISGYAPEFENDTEKYIGDVAGMTGANAKTPLSSINADALARAVARKESSTTIGGEPLPGTPAAPLGAPAQPVTNQLGAMGLRPSEAQVQGMPLAPEEMEARRANIMNQAHSQQGAVQQAADQRVKGRQEVIDYMNHEQLRRQTDAQAEMVKQAKIQEEAGLKVKEAQLQQLDPRRITRNMSFGDILLGALAVMGSAAGQTMQQRAGVNAPNMALQTMQKAIDDDLKVQQEDKQSRVAYWSKVFGDSESGMKAAKAEMLGASALTLQSKLQNVENADIQAAASVQVQGIQSQADALWNELKDKEAQRLTVKYEPPVAPPPGALGGVPKIGRVGIEDKDPETREVLANAYDPSKPADRSQMSTLTKEMQQITKLEQTQKKFEELYGVRPDADGRYPTKGGESAIYNSTATGPWYNVVDAVTPDDERDRALKDAWAQVEGDTRMGWQTEPNGETTQIRLSGINMPKRDEEVGQKLNDLREEIERRKLAIMSGTNAPVRAAWKLQNNYPMTGASQTRKRQAAPGEIITP
jgi:hypothetical protein